MTRRLLLLSNSRDAEGRFLHYPQRQIRAFLGARVRSVLFVPFAAVVSGAVLSGWRPRVRSRRDELVVFASVIVLSAVVNLF